MKVIILNGPMGVGKTSVGKHIALTNAGTAFIDGDWCMDLHPFVGNGETKAMAIDNILHMIRNYQKSSFCQMIVLVWLMDDEWLKVSLKSLPLFSNLENVVDTTGLSISEIAEKIIG